MLFGAFKLQASSLSSLNLPSFLLISSIPSTPVNRFIKNNISKENSLCIHFIYIIHTLQLPYSLKTKMLFNISLHSHKYFLAIIIISQTATQTGWALSYTPEGASRVSSPVRKMKTGKREAQIITIKKKVK